jgi:hypothetical protein
MSIGISICMAARVTQALEVALISYWVNVQDARHRADASAAEALDLREQVANAHGDSRERVERCACPFFVTSDTLCVDRRGRGG